MSDDNSISGSPADAGHKETKTEVRRLGPVAAAERITAVDVIRGFAVLGILVINIDFFALPGAIYFNPTVAGGFTGINLLAWQFGSIFFLQKFMAIFSMLFGAGLILLYTRAEKADRPLRGFYYRRILWLLLFGLAHGYLLWHGDILFNYAICGLLLYPLRRLSGRWLIGLGLLPLILGILIQMGSGYYFGILQHEAKQADLAMERGESLTPHQEMLSQAWTEISAMFDVSPEELAAETEAYRGSYLEALTYRAPETLIMQTQALLFIMFWRVAGLMLLGMGLMKLGVFSAARSRRFYIVSIIIGYGIGLSLCSYGTSSLIEHGFDFVYAFRIGNHFNYIGSILVALAHVGVVMLICKAGVLTWLSRRLAAVGQMALTNYLMHTIICTTIFYGYGFGLFGQIERFGLLGFVLAVWILQLSISPIWLRRYRFGPAEWLWRSLTYWRRQPMKTTPISR